MVPTKFQNNTELNAGGILASYNVHTKVPLEPAGDTQRQVDVLRS